jgi:hypothetical protein
MGDPTSSYATAGCQEHSNTTTTIRYYTALQQQRIAHFTVSAVTSDPTILNKEYQADPVSTRLTEKEVERKGGFPSVNID